MHTLHMDKVSHEWRSSQTKAGESGEAEDKLMRVTAAEKEKISTSKCSDLGYFLLFLL